MNSSKIQTLTIAALFAALTCVATMMIRIPTPATNGYIHLGDTMVILCGIFLGPVYGALAAGIGSAFSDLLGGYFLYVPATFIIKAFVAMIVSILYKKLDTITKTPALKCSLCGIVSTTVVVLGYCIFEFFISGNAAFLNIPANIVQGVSGLVISSILLPLLLKIPSFHELVLK